MSWTPSFDDFKMLYPRREAWVKGERAWNRLTLAQRRSAMLALPAHIKKWLERGEVEFIPLPASWLNGARFNDEIHHKLINAVTPTRIPQAVLQDSKPPADLAVAKAKIAVMKRTLTGSR